LNEAVDFDGALHVDCIIALVRKVVKPFEIMV